MAKNKAQKKKIVQDLSEKIKDAKSVVIADFTGLKVADSEALRKKCKEQSVYFTATKKTLLNLALKEQGLDLDAGTLEGSLGVAVSQEDEVAAAKIVKEFAKDHEQVTFQAGMLEGTLISVEKLKQLADLPSKQELLAKVVGSLKAPISGFVNVLSGNLRGLINVLNAIKETK